MASTVRDSAQRLLTPLRRRYYVDGRGRDAIGRLPAGVRRKTGLDDPSALDSRKVEIGCGPFPQEGYIHVDIDPRARHLEAVTDAWNLPFPDDWASEIVAVHSLEHVPPPQLVPTLQEWLRVLQPGGEVRIHVPNTAELLQSMLDSPVEAKWRTMGAALGMYCHPGVMSPDELGVASDHQIMFDWPMLEWALTQAGFAQIQDRTEEETDKHTDGWREVVPHFSLIARARKPGGEVS